MKKVLAIYVGGESDFILSFTLGNCLRQLSQISPSAELQQSLSILSQPHPALVRPGQNHRVEGLCFQSPDQPAAQAAGVFARLQTTTETTATTTTAEEVEDEEE